MKYSEKSKAKEELELMTKPDAEDNLEFLTRVANVTEELRELEIQLLTYFSVLTNSLKSLGPKIDHISREWQYITRDIYDYVKGDWTNYVSTMQYYQKYSYSLCMFLQNKTPYGDKNLERSNTEFWDYLCKHGIVLPRFVSENIINHQAVVKPSTAPWVLNELFDYLAPRETVFSAEARNRNRYKNSEYITRELFRYRLEDQLKASTNMVNSQTAQIKALAMENDDLKNTITKLAKKEATKEVSNNYELKLEKKLAEC